MTIREQRLVFGEVAQEYDDVRAGYPAELVDAVVAYMGHVPAHIVEVGAGTGKATAAFAALHTPMTCVEPDPAMASVLAARFAGEPRIDVRIARFEDWPPPDAGVDLVISAQAWHWVTQQTRMQLAQDALAPGGVLALLGHTYGFVEPSMDEALTEVYRRLAPELVIEPSRPDASWTVAEMEDSPLFTDATSIEFHRAVPYPTHDYLRLLTTFSPHRMLPADRRDALLAGVAETVDALGGIVHVQLDTPLALGRTTRIR